MNLFGLALINLRRRPTRTVLSTIGIGLAVGGAVALLSLGQGIRSGVGDSLNERGADLIVSQRASTDAFGGRLPETLGARLATIPGVAGVDGELIAFAANESGRPILVAGAAPGSAAGSSPGLAARPAGAGAASGSSSSCGSSSPMSLSSDSGGSSSRRLSPK